MKLLKPLSLLAASALLVACAPEDGPPSNLAASSGTSGPVAIYSPTIAQVPLPTDLFFSGTTDLTLNLPSQTAPAQAANSLDGWSTLAPITAKFNAPINPATLIAGVTVRVFRVCIDPFTTKPTGGIGELIAGTDYSVGLSAVGTSATPAESTLVIKPLRALPPKFNAASASCPTGAQGSSNQGTGFIVVLTHGTTPVAVGGTRVEIRAADNQVVTGSDFYTLAKGTSCLFRFAAAETGSDCPITDPADSGNPGLTPAGAAAGLSDAPAASQGKTETLRRLTNGHEFIVTGISAQVAAGFGANAPAAINSADIILAWQFSPQSVGNVISAVNTAFTTDPDGAGAEVAPSSQTPVLTDSTFDTGHADLINTGGTATAGEVFTGTVSLPYYLSAPSGSNPTAFLTEHWESAPNATFGNTTNLTFANPLPAKKFDQTVPVFAVVPKAALASPATPVPVVIVQHGIGSNRTNIVALAEALAQAGLATIAIDMPLHGLNDSSNAFHAGAGAERNFGALTSGTQSSGAFLNISNLETGRDNLRQGIVDLLALEELIPNMTLTSGANSLTFDTNRIYFVGHSLGGITGTAYLANSDRIKAATLAMSGGGIGKLLDGSAAFGSTVSGGLAANGISEGEKTYEDFLVLAQTLVDTADPLNHAAKLAATTMPIHFIEIVGNLGVGANPPDVVVPNDAFNRAPTDDAIPEPGLGGSDPLIDALALTRINGSTENSLITDSPIRSAVTFETGFHSSILQPSDSATGISAPDVFAEIAKEVAQFLASNGTCLPVGSSTSCLAPPP